MVKAMQDFTVNAANEGRLRLGPLGRGTAERFGAALRRVLLRDVGGAGVSALRLAGMHHPFALPVGLLEDGVQLVENLRALRLSLRGTALRHVKVRAEGPCRVTAGDLAVDPSVGAADPEQVIATVIDGASLDMTVEIARGCRAHPLPPRAGRSLPNGWIEVGAIPAPVRWVALNVTGGDDQAFLDMTVVTDGTVLAGDALLAAAEILAVQSPAGGPFAALAEQAIRCVRQPVAGSGSASSGSGSVSFGTPDAPIAGEGAAKCVDADGPTASRPLPASAPQEREENRNTTPPRRTPAVRHLGRITPEFAVPNLTGLVRESFDRFLQPDSHPDHRREQGLEALLRAAFRARSADARMEYAGYDLGPAELPIDACRRYGRTFGRPLSIRVRDRQRVVLQRLPAGSMPLITAWGTFVIAGIETVVVNRLDPPVTPGSSDLTGRRLHRVGEQLAAALRGAVEQDVAALDKAALDESAQEAAFTVTAAALRSFFTSSRNARRLNAANPLARLCQVRAVSVQGVDRHDLAARDVHPSHCGRVCLLETPEGERIGLNLAAAILAIVDSDGCLLTPYRRRTDGGIEYLPADRERTASIADGVPDEEYGQRYGGQLLARVHGDIQRVHADRVEYEPVHPAQTLGAAASLIPLAAHDDANRALMGANMLKQAVPLLAPEAPLVRSGMEERIGRDSGVCRTARAAGTVTQVTADCITVQEHGEGVCAYVLEGFGASSLGTSTRLRPAVRPGDRVDAGQLLAAGMGAADGQLAPGRNLLVGYLPFEGFNFEDSLVISERLVREEVLTSVTVREYVATVRHDDRGEHLGAAHLPAAEAAGLDADGIVPEGIRVSGGDVLMARARLDAGDGATIRTTRSGAVCDTSVRLPMGQRGTVIRVERYDADAGHPLEPGIRRLVRVTVAVRRRLQVGDKLANRHGAKGTVGLILPEDEMPVLPDGRPLDLIFSPLSVPSRMNLGQVLETHLGLAAHELGCAIVTPAFAGATAADVEALLTEAGLPASGMLRLRDGRTGRLFDTESTVGYHYVMKLAHMVDERHQARGVGRYEAHTQQPVGGRARGGGLRLGIMDTWALQAQGAAHVLQELLTVQSDDVAAGLRLVPALLQGTALPDVTVPHSVRVLVARLRGLCLDLRLYRDDGAEVDVFADTSRVDQATWATLTCAGPERVRQWEAAPVAPVDLLAGRQGPPADRSSARRKVPADLLSARKVTPEAVAPACTTDDQSVPGTATLDSGLRLLSLQLPAPVAHPWRHLIPELAESLPAIRILPVLPSSLLPGAGFDRLYTAVARAATGEGDLQAAVDALFGERGLTRELYGKRGWIAAAISGKTVDFSARSVIAPGCHLRHDECGLPRRLAKVLFEPMVAGVLMRTGRAGSGAEARAALAADDPGALAVLHQVVAAHRVLLRRAPVLHAWGIQAFRPVLTDENVIRLHPLTMVGFNADFDGDEMDVFLPLSAAAQAEADTMRPVANLLGTASGDYMNGLTQDMVLGWYYATVRDPAGRVHPVATLDQVAAAHERGVLHVHEAIMVEGRRTTVGRALLNHLLPPPLRWVEGPADKRLLAGLLQHCREELGAEAAARLGDVLMRAGFRHATLSGLSIGRDTLPQYAAYERELAAAWEQADRLQAGSGAEEQAGTSPTQVWVAHWTRVTSAMTEGALRQLAADRDGLNPVHLMLVSGARGNRSQVQQHLALRGLLATPDRQIIAAPCTTSFLRGQSPLEHLAGVMGARKGLIHTALASARAGFLFKRIVNATQDVLVTEEDCGTTVGLIKTRGDGEDQAAFALRLAGRTAAEDKALPGDKPEARPGGEPDLVVENEIIGRSVAERLAPSGRPSVAVRSPLGCRSATGICARCYGADPADGRCATLGLPVGIRAAQALGEPATQLTFRTFYVGVGDNERRLGDPIGGLPRLDQLLEIGRQPGPLDAAESRRLEEMMQLRGAMPTGEYLVKEIGWIYRMQGVRLDERHIEVVVRQLVGHVRVSAPGSTELRAGQVVGRAKLEAVNAATDGEPAQAEPVLLGLTEIATLAQDFVAAALAPGGIPAFARAAVRGSRLELHSMRAATLFGKRIPAQRRQD